MHTRHDYKCLLILLGLLSFGGCCLDRPCFPAAEIPWRVGSTRAHSTLLQSYTLLEIEETLQKLIHSLYLNDRNKLTGIRTYCFPYMYFVSRWSFSFALLLYIRPKIVLQIIHLSFDLWLLFLLYILSSKKPSPPPFPLSFFFLLYFPQHFSILLLKFHQPWIPLSYNSPMLNTPE